MGKLILWTPNILIWKRYTFWYGTWYKYPEICKTTTQFIIVFIFSFRTRILNMRSIACFFFCHKYLLVNGSQRKLNYLQLFQRWEQKKIPQITNPTKIEIPGEEENSPDQCHPLKAYLLGTLMFWKTTHRQSHIPAWLLINCHGVGVILHLRQ